MSIKKKILLVGWDPDVVNLSRFANLLCHPVKVMFTVMMLLLNSTAESSDLDIWEGLDLSPVSSIELPASTLSGKWKVIKGLRVDNLNNLEDVSESQLQTVENLAKQLLPLGIQSAADFTLSSADFPLNTVTVKVYIFNNAQQCQSWWKKKYQYAGWQQHYQPVEQINMFRVDSLQMNKSAFAFSHVWLTTHQLQDGKEHIDAANHIIRLLTDGKISL